MKSHYFNQKNADSDDRLLQMSIQQGYVPKTCLLGGQTVWGLVKEGEIPCLVCNCSREKCLSKKQISNYSKGEIYVKRIKT